MQRSSRLSLKNEKDEILFIINYYFFFKSFYYHILLVSTIMATCVLQHSLVERETEEFSCCLFFSMQRETKQNRTKKIKKENKSTILGGLFGFFLVMIWKAFMQHQTFIWCKCTEGKSLPEILILQTTTRGHTGKEKKREGLKWEEKIK